MSFKRAIGFGLAFFASTARCQQISELDRGRAKDMLPTVSDEVRKHYDDPQLHGLDWDAKLAKAKQQTNEAESFNMAMSHVAAMLDTLDDLSSPPALSASSGFNTSRTREPVE